MTGFRGQPVAGAGRPPKNQSPNKRVVVPFEDNRHLTRLLGEFDSHLALVEDRLGIEAHAHGNVVTLSGPRNPRTVTSRVASITAAPLNSSISTVEFSVLTFSAPLM